MNDFDVKAREFFDEVRTVWSGFGRYLIIPFCTPVIERPDVLVVGQNHACFEPNVREPWHENDLIGIEMSKGIPKINTFLEHEHDFAMAINKISKEIGVPVTERWVGTNRCSVQMDGTEFKKVSRSEDFKLRERETDRMLKKFILDHIRPKNILLSGKYAAALFFKDRRMRDLADEAGKPLKMGADIGRIFPLYHPSGRWTRQYFPENVRRLRDGGFCGVEDA
jgi:hypothetical protein